MNFKMHTLLLASCFVMLNACSTTRTGDRLVSMNEAKTLQADEWTSFANQLRDSMSPSVNRLVGQNNDQPIILTLGNFVNKTPRREFSDARDVMYNEIRKSLVNTGLVRVSMLGAGEAMMSIPSWPKSKKTRGMTRSSPTQAMWTPWVRPRSPSGCCSGKSFPSNPEKAAGRNTTTPSTSVS